MSNVSWFRTPATLLVSEIYVALVDLAKTMPDCRVERETPERWIFEWKTYGVSVQRSDRYVRFCSDGTPQGDWLDYKVRNILGYKFDGLCSSEDDPTTYWAPDPNRWPTFEDWLAKFYGTGPIVRPNETP